MALSEDRRCRASPLDGRPQCISSTIEDVARRLGVSAEMVENILGQWAGDEKKIDPTRKITDVGLDEISLKKGHNLYVTILTDLTDPERPAVLAVFPGRDEQAAINCLKRLSPEQRQMVRTHRTDMCKAYPAACDKLLPKSKHVADRFHVAKRLGEVVDLRKKSPGPTRRNSPRISSRSCLVSRIGGLILVREGCRDCDRGRI